MGELEDGGEVDLDDVLPVFRAGVDGGIAEDDAGVVDEDVDAAEVCVTCGKRTSAPLVAERSAWKAAAVPPIACGGFVGGAAVAVDGDGGSGFGECRGDGCARPLAEPVTRATLLSRRKEFGTLG